MNFNTNKLPSSTREIEWHWKQRIQERFDLSHINIGRNVVNFNLPSDYFELSDTVADKIALVGRRYAFFSQTVYMTEIELSIFGNIGVDTQIGVLLSNIKHLRPTADVYGLFAKYKYIEKTVYCGITVCFVDRDTGEEMDAAVFEIGDDGESYALPIAISEETLDYYTLDDLAKLAYWLGNFWVGIQYELNNYPEEILIIEQRGPITANQEAELRKEKRPIWVKRSISVDADGNEIKYAATGSGRQFTVPSWGVRGHNRTLADGRIIPVRPHRKGKDRKNPEALVSKEYQFVEDKIHGDIEK